MDAISLPASSRRALVPTFFLFKRIRRKGSLCCASGRSSLPTVVGRRYDRETLDSWVDDYHRHFLAGFSATSWGRLRPWPSAYSDITGISLPPSIREAPFARHHERPINGPGSLHLAIHRHDGSTTQAQIVLKCNLGTLHLACVGLAAQLPTELCALGETGRAQGMALRDQTP